ncbi:FKBP-type peptidyl-prolyl cis-trans isomerase [Candidatus Woesearchaeota archaeon]|nr:FKBP-type peptidyl-prolyl cis-trans isomerase [Candidatus Woesearchaeota archaeon]
MAEPDKDYGDKIKAVEDKKDDDIEIDLSKITNLFRRQKAAASPSETKNTGSDNETKKIGSDNRESGSEKTADAAKTNDADKDDSIQIDFGKIKGIFSQNKGVKSSEIAGKAVTGLKGVFKGGKSSSGEDAVDVKAAMKFLQKHYVTLFLAIGIIVSVWLGFSIRMQAGDLAFTEGWARNSIDVTIRNDISTFVSQQYPNLPEKNRETRIAEELQKAHESGLYTFRTGQFAGQTANIEQQVEVTSAQLKAFFQDEQGRGYMPDIDPYYWWRYARNIVETGSQEDKIVNGYVWDSYQLAPQGRGISPEDTFYPKLIAWFYKAGKIFNNDLELARAVMFFPVFISALTTIVVFMIAKRIAGNIAAFFAATMVSVHASLLSRTQFGHADSDAIAIFFSVLILWLFIEAFSAQKTWLRIILAASSAFATLLYSLTWGGWWWILDFLLAASLGTLGLFALYKIALAGNLKALQDKAIRRAATAIAAYYIAGIVFFGLFSSISRFALTPFASLGFRSIKEPVVASAAPNVLRTVAELNEGTVQTAIQQLGNSLFYIALLGIMLLIARAAYAAFRKKSDTEKIMKDIFYVAILSTWLIATLYSVTKGIRFVLLVVPAFSIAFGVAFGLASGWISSFAAREFKVPKIVFMAAIFPFLILVFPGLTFNGDIVKESKTVVQNDIPLVNDAWYSSLTAIRDNSEENAVITSWWDFGHHFKALADRPVTFDGTTQLTMQAHWVGRMLSTHDETEAIGILRMLDCGAVTAQENLSKIVEDDPNDVRGILLVKKIILMGREEARQQLLNEGLTDEQADDILERTHCSPPQAFVIASEDMVGKSGVWGHFGSWNFTKADIFKATMDSTEGEAVQYMKDKFGISEQEAIGIYEQVQSIGDDDGAADAWIGPWNGFAGVEGCNAGEIITCGDGLRIDTNSYDAWYPTPEGNLHPLSFSYLTAEGIVRKEYTNNTIPQNLGIVLAPSGSGFVRIAGSPDIVDGIFSRLYYLKGHGLKHFKLLTQQYGFTGTNVWVWEVDWEGKQTNIVDELKPVEVKTAAASGDEVTLNYIGYFDDGTVFDTSIQEENVTSETAFNESFSYRPFTFRLGQGAVIAGFEEGLIGAKLEEEKIIEVPPEKGYTEPGHPLYNRTIYFKIKITNIK